MFAADTARIASNQQHNLQRYRTLVLNADYRPLSTTPLSLWNWRDSIEAVCKDRFQVLEAWDGPIIRSQRAAFPVPKVIISNEYVRTSSHRIPALTRLNCALRDRFRCGYCGQRFKVNELTFDHVIPRSRGGLSTWDNLLMACAPCNRAKGCSPANYNGVRGEVRKGNFVPLTRPHQPTMGELYKIGLQFIPPEIQSIFGNYLPLPKSAAGMNDQTPGELDRVSWDTESYWTVELER